MESKKRVCCIFLAAVVGVRGTSRSQDEIRCFLASWTSPCRPEQQLHASVPSAVRSLYSPFGPSPPPSFRGGGAVGGRGVSARSGVGVGRGYMWVWGGMVVAGTRAQPGCESVPGSWRSVAWRWRRCPRATTMQRLCPDLSTACSRARAGGAGSLSQIPPDSIRRALRIGVVQPRRGSRPKTSRAPAHFPHPWSVRDSAQAARRKLGHSHFGAGSTRAQVPGLAQPP